MNSRILLFMLIGVVTAIMIRLAWPSGRWSLGYQVQLAIVVLATVLASVFNNQPALAYVAWTLFGVVVLLPALLSSQAHKLLLTGHVRDAARRWKWMSFLVWGRMGQRYGEYSELFNSVHTEEIEAIDRRFEEMLSKPQPLQVKGSLLSLKFLVYTLRGEWQKGVTFFESIGKWGSSETSIGPRLQVARAYAELGNLPEAIGQLNRVLSEPQSFRYRDAIFLTLAPVYSLAGDLDRLKALLRQHHALVRRLPRAFVPYWMGRCHMTRGDREQAALAFHEARSAVPSHHTRWRDAVDSKLAKLEGTSELGRQPFAATQAYGRAMAKLEQTKQDTREIRTLLDLVHPGALTTGLVLALVGVHIAVVAIVERYWDGRLDLFFQQIANVPQAVTQLGEWWRLLTAIFLHGGWLHLALNAVTLLAFGSAVERLWGRGRTFVLFLVSGLVGNGLSAYFAGPSTMPSVGASGGAFGLLAAYWLSLVWAQMPRERKFKWRLVILLSAIIVIDLVFGLLSVNDQFAEFFDARIDNWAHFGGFAFGLVAGYFLRPKQETRR